MSDVNYLDELVLYEHGKYDITKYKEWIDGWTNWLKSSTSFDTQSEERATKERVNSHLQIK
jgi:hypothetical protein